MSRQRISDPAIRRPRSLIWPGLLILMASWFAALLFTAPNTLIPVSRLALPPGVQLMPLSGTLWHGRWRLNVPHAPALTIHTDFLPLSILRLQPTWRVRVRSIAQDGKPRADLNISADVAPGRSKLSIRKLEGRLDAGSPLIAARTAWPLAGFIDCTGEATLVREKTGFYLNAAHIEAHWRRAQITTTEPLQLGDLTLNLDIASGQLNASARPASGTRGPVSGELKLTGAWPIKTAPSVRGYLQPTPLASDGLRQQLNLLGRPDANGKVTIQGVPRKTVTSGPSARRTERSDRDISNR